MPICLSSVHLLPETIYTMGLFPECSILAEMLMVWEIVADGNTTMSMELEVEGELEGLLTEKINTDT